MADLENVVNAQDSQNLQSQAGHLLETLIDAIKRNDLSGLKSKTSVIPLEPTFESVQARESDVSKSIDFRTSGVSTYIAVADPSEENSYMVVPNPGTQLSSQLSKDILSSTFEVKELESQDDLVIGENVTISRPAKFNLEDKVFKLSEKGIANIELTQKIDDMNLELWNKVKSGQIPENAIPISETESSVSNRRRDTSLSPRLGQASNHSYLAIPTQDPNVYLLVPKLGLKLSAMSYDTFQSIYDTAEYSIKDPIKNVVPAKLKFDLDKNEFHLIEKGKINPSIVETQEKIAKGEKQSELKNSNSEQNKFTNQKNNRKDALLKEGKERLQKSQKLADLVLSKIKSCLPLDRKAEPVRVVVGSCSVIKADTQDVLIPMMTDGQQSALEGLLKQDSPKGTVKIFVGQEELFKIKDGVIQRDDLGLFPDQNKDIIKGHEKSLSSESQLKLLSDELASQSSRIEVLEKRLKELEKPRQLSVNSKINEFLNSVRSAAATQLKETTTFISQQVKEKADKDIQSVKSISLEVRHKVTAKAANWLVKVAEPGISKMLDRVGEKSDDGSLLFSSKEYDFSKKDGEISIRRKVDGNILTAENITGRDQSVMNKIVDTVKTLESESQSVSQSQKIKPQSVKPKM